MLKRFLLSAIPFAVLAPFAVVGVSAAPANFPDPTTDIPTSTASKHEKAVLAGGCFWGMEAVFESLKGVSKVVSGFAGGAKNTANYETVSEGRTGHAESVEITYDPSQISYGQILKVYFSVAHDPTQLNRQGPDFGTQYRSVIFTHGPEQARIARERLEALKASGRYKGPVVTQIEPAPAFWRAEDYHQRYFQKHGGHCHVSFAELQEQEAAAK